MRWLDNLNAPPKAPRRPHLDRWKEQTLAAAWLGHATVLLRIGETTILTDPVLCNRVGIGLGLITGGPRRHVAPALSIRELPEIDLILVSHAHYDHLDRPTLNRLDKNTPVITAGGTFDLVRDLGYRRVAELRWGESTSLYGLKFKAQKVAHWGARSFFDKHRGYNAYVIESPKHRVLYGGDSAFGEHFKEVGKVDLAILGIGGYNPYLQSHANPEQVWQMADHCRAETILPMHHSTFRLSHEPKEEPLQRLLTAAGNGADRICVTEIGGQWVSPN
jgi:L-ascorbate metabolism protein UlaG (beta-lactamase superfamily)